MRPPVPCAGERGGGQNLKDTALTSLVQLSLRCSVGDGASGVEGRGGGVSRTGRGGRLSRTNP